MDYCRKVLRLGPRQRLLLARPGHSAGGPIGANQELALDIALEVDAAARCVERDNAFLASASTCQDVTQL